MPYDTHAPKTALTVSVNADVLKDARALGLDIDDVVDAALRTKIVKRRRLLEEQERMRPTIAAWNELDRKYGVAIDEFLDY